MLLILPRTSLHATQRGFNFGCSVIADAILPNFSNATSAFVSQYLHDVQTNRPAASNPSSLVGMYSGTTSETGPISFNVTANAQGQLSLRVTFSLQIDVLLFPNQNNQNNDEFQMHFPLDAPYDCVTESVLGWDGAIVLIQGDSLSLPNLLVGAAFSKQ